MPETLTQSAGAASEPSHAADLMRAVYRQVFGNAHLMEEETQPSIESQFLNGSLTVQGLVTALGQSATYRKLFLDRNGPYRFVELNFKHLLGRAPRDQQEISEHVQLLANEGLDAEIASYTFSDEYMCCFGLDTVPYPRNTTTLGESNLTYTRTKALEPGYAGFDGATSSRLLSSLASGIAPSMSARKPGGGTDRGNRRYQVLWRTAAPVGMVRRSVQRSIVPFSSLSATLQSIQARGGSILSVANT